VSIILITGVPAKIYRQHTPVYFTKSYLIFPLVIISMHYLFREALLNVSPPLVGFLKRLRARKDSFSQFGEDIVLWNLLNYKSNGFYVDCGAFDPYIFLTQPNFTRQDGVVSISNRRDPDGLSFRG